VSLSSRCWFCSGEIGATDRAKVVADLNVVVHAGCFDQLYETEGLRSWSIDRRGAEPCAPTNDDDDEEASES
jgi:hypothetical protein